MITRHHSTTQQSQRTQTPTVTLNHDHYTPTYTHNPNHTHQTSPLIHPQSLTCNTTPPTIPLTPRLSKLLSPSSTRQGPTKDLPQHHGALPWSTRGAPGSPQQTNTLLPPQVPGGVHGSCTTDPPSPIQDCSTAAGASLHSDR